MMTMPMTITVAKSPQRRHHSNDDGDCDSNSANDAEIDDDIDDGGMQQRKEMRQKHCSPDTQTNQHCRSG